MGEVANLLTGFPFESKKFVREGIKLVRGMNVKRGYLDFSEELCECWSSSQGLENYLLNSGDILIQMDGALIGKSYAKIKENQLPALLVQRVTRVRIQNQISDGSFVYQQIQKGFLTYIKGTKTETAVPHLSLNDIESFEIATPSVDEEKKIGAFFESLDHLITLHQRKYDKLQVLKKAMLEKMFPKNGSSVPEIRFKGFTDAWEQRKLGEVANLLTGFPFESKKFVREGIKLVRGMNVKRGYLDFSEELCECWSSSQGLENYLLNSGDILIQMDGALIGKSYAKIKENQLPALLVQRVTRVRIQNQISDGSFVYQQIQKGFLTYIKGTKTETAVPHLSLNDIESFEIATPSVDEEKKIGAFFESLDHLITLHQRELEKLQNIKKSMLEKMFV